MQRLLLPAIAAILFVGCGGQKQPATQAPQPAAPATQEAAIPDGPPPMRNLPATTIGPYEVQPMYEDEIEDGHINIAVSGGDVEAVRIWTGPEDAVGVMVYRTEVEYHYHHGHLDIPSPIPPDLLLWIEIEAPDGQVYKGSTPLRPAE